MTNNNTFKVGDLVRYLGSHELFPLTEGKIYEVVSISDCGAFIRVTTDYGEVAGFLPSRFAKVYPKPVTVTVDRTDLDKALRVVLLSLLSPKVSRELVREELAGASLIRLAEALGIPAAAETVRLVVETATKAAAKAAPKG